jgi:uncharacterized small protein (DUF1192 family)
MSEEIDFDKVHAWQEIKRLKAEIKDLRGQLAIPGLQMQKLMDVEYAEIERLKAENNKWVKDSYKTMVEIDRLKHEIRLLRAELETLKAMR